MDEKTLDIVPTSTHAARPIWGNYAQFILSCIGYSIGFGDIWRFPYLAYSNGGGAFLIPYWCSVLMAGLPFYFLELSLGQYSSMGANCIFGKLAPMFEGIGWAMMAVSFIVAIYYNMIVAWVLYYLCDSFRATLPWSSCLHDYNSDLCYSNLEDKRCKTLLNDTSARFYAKQCWNSSSVIAMGINDTMSRLQLVSPTEEYFNKHILNVSTGFEDTGAISWKLVLCLAGAWLLVFACFFSGIQSSGKAVYFTATFPYVIILILLIRGATLPGALEGVKFYVIPDFTKLKELKVWVDAAVQVFYSLGPAFGSIITMASYNPFRNNCRRDALIVALVDTLTSMVAGCAIFSIAGFMAQDLNVPVGNVTQSGLGLAFIAYPEALVRLPVSQLWSVLFFVMLVLLGLDSEFSTLETVSTAILDQFPNLRRWKTLVIALLCLACFLPGLIFCSGVKHTVYYEHKGDPWCFYGTKDRIDAGVVYARGNSFFQPLPSSAVELLYTHYTALYCQNISAHSRHAAAYRNAMGLLCVVAAGIYYFVIFNDYSCGYCLILIALFECLVVSYVYGLNNFVRDITVMLGFSPNLYFKICWSVVAPLFMIFILIFTFVGYGPSNYGPVILSGKAETFGWILSVLSIMFIPGFAIFHIARVIYKGQPWRTLFTTSPDWHSAERRLKDTWGNEVKSEKTSKV